MLHGARQEGGHGGVHVCCGGLGFLHETQLRIQMLFIRLAPDPDISLVQFTLYGENA